MERIHKPTNKRRHEQALDRIRAMFPGVECYKQDHHQGIPDWLLLYGPYWAMLEIKKSATAPEEPNQQHWVNYYNNMSFAAIIYPENEEEVLRGLQLAFGYQG